MSGIIADLPLGLPTRQDIAFYNGWDAARKGFGILSNPYIQDSPDFRWFVDGWCKFHSTDAQP